MILAGDVGGTKTILGIFISDNSESLKLYNNTLKIFYNSDYASLELLVENYLSNIKLKIEKAVFAVAGPVTDGQSKMTNLTWLINEKKLQDLLNIPCVRLINDLEAIGWTVPFLKPDEKYMLNEGVNFSEGNIAVIAPGTGLGESFLTWCGDRYYSHATEGGHSDFAPTNSLEIRLLDYFFSFYDHVSYEKICSGMGIPYIYSFFRDREHIEEPLWLREKLSEAEDAVPVIVNTALNKENSCGICSLTLNMFLSVLGAEAGNLALKVMAKGGVYLGGGIPPRIPDFFNNGRFMKSFQNKGRMSGIMKNFPVYVILNPEAALWGAAIYGFKN